MRPVQVIQSKALHETWNRCKMFHVTKSVMGSAITQRVRKHRESLRAAGLRPVQLWLPDTSSESYRRKCEQESRLLANDPHEAEILDWIDKAADTDGWA
jgi:hypothetical protein